MTFPISLNSSLTTFPFICYKLAILVLLFPEQDKFTPTSGPLHLSFILPRAWFTRFSQESFCPSIWCIKCYLCKEAFPHHHPAPLLCSPPLCFIFLFIFIFNFLIFCFIFPLLFYTLLYLLIACLPQAECKFHEAGTLSVLFQQHPQHPVTDWHIK